MMLNRSRANLQQGIDLLGIHQFRRENAALQKQIQQQQLNICDIADKATAAHDAAIKAVNLADKVSVFSQKHLSEQNSMRSNFEDSNKSIKDLESRLFALQTKSEDKRRSLEQSLAVLQDQYEILQSRLLNLESRLETQLLSEDVVDDLKACLHTKTDSEITRVLEGRLLVLETKLGYNKVLRSSVSHIDNSFEAPAGGDHEDGSSISLHQPGLLYANHPPDSHTKDSELMLTFRQHSESRQTAEPAESEDLDLDSNVVSMSYARNIQHNVIPQAALISLPKKNDLVLKTRDESQQLKQGRLHSWDRYFTELEALSANTAQVDKAFLVHQFVDGLYDSSLRNKISARLDDYGWTLANLKQLPDNFGQYSNSPTQLSSMSQHDAELEHTESNKKTIRTEALQEDSQAAPRRSRRLRLKDAKSQIDTQTSEIPQNSCMPTAQSRLKQQIATKKPVKAKTRPSQKRQATPYDAQVETRSRKRQRNSIEPVKLLVHPGTTADGHTPLISKAVNQASDQSLVRKATPSALSAQRRIIVDAAQVVPRLVENEKAISKRQGRRDDVEEDLTQDEEALPRLPTPVQLKTMQTKRRHRLPLPPPPQIPILPTSDN